MVYPLFTIFLLGETFPMFSPTMKMEIICKSFSPEKLTYKLTTSRFIKMIGWFLGNKIGKKIVGPFFYVLLGETFPNVSQACQTEITCKRYAPGEVDLETYHIRVHKTIRVSYCRVIFSVHHTQNHGVVPIHYFTLHWGLSSSLLINPCKDGMQKLRPRELDIPTYHFRVHKNVGISSCIVIFREHHR